jgi:eukaryotic-like serine/threonine-protein kinase
MNKFQPITRRYALLLASSVLSVLFVSSCKNDLQDIKPDRKTATAGATATLPNTVYTGNTDGTFYALDALSGALKWKYEAGGNFSYSAPAVSNGVVYAGNTNNNMYAMDAASGKLLWTYSTGNSIESSPAVANGMVYFGSDDHSFYAVNITDGSLKWKYQTGYNVSSSPAVFDGVVFFGSDDNNLYALDAATGSVKWQYNAGSIFNASSPIIDNGTIYIGSRAGDLLAVNVMNGQLKWKYSNPDRVSFEQTTAAVVNDMVYISGWYNVSTQQPGSVYALNANDGSLKWESLNGLGFTRGPAVSNGKLYIAADDGNLYALDASNGNVLWKSVVLPNGSGISVANSVVYTAGGGSFYTFDATGNKLWQYAQPTSFADSKAYVTDVNGY